LTKDILKKNIDRILDIERYTSKDLGVSLYGSAWGEKNFMLDLEGKWEYSSAAVKNNKIIAYLIVSKWSCNLHGHRMAMHESCSKIEKIRLADLLYKTTENVAKSDKIRSITAIVPINNKPTQHYYKKRKFKELSHRDLNIYIHKRKLNAFADAPNILIDKITDPKQPSRSLVYRYFY